MAQTGTVKVFREDKGFGFIAPSDGGSDVFVHIKECNGAEKLFKGDKVSFDTQWNDRKGKMQAMNCTVVKAGTVRIPAHGGLPDMTVLLTSDEVEAAAFIEGWQGTHHFGLDLEQRPVFKKGDYSRAALLQICAGPWVLIFDLKAIRNRTLKPLPDALQNFLENENHIFYGQGLSKDLARLAFEFDCVANGIDFGQGKAWQDKCGGTLVVCANRVLETSVTQSRKLHMTNWDRRPLSEKEVQCAAEDAYLSWALAEHFIKLEPPRKEWMVTRAEIYRKGETARTSGNCVPVSVHDWSAVEQEAAAEEAAAKKAMKEAAKAESQEVVEDNH